MAKLFISYKRKTPSISPFVSGLMNRGFAVWFDREDVVTGTSNWMEEIHTGLRTCNGLVLCLTEKVCDSEVIKYELAKATELQLPIFVVVLEPGVDKKKCVQALTLPENIQFNEDFLGGEITTWDHAFTKLIDHFGRFDIRLSRHVLRQRNGPEKEIFQTYLRQLKKDVAYVNLSQILPQEINEKGLESIYVPLSTNLSLSLEIDKFRVIGRWIGKRTGNNIARNLGEIGSWHSVDIAALDALSAQLQLLINGEIRSEFINEAKRPLILSHFWSGIKENVWPLTVANAVALTDRLVVIGEAGSGKTTFAKQLALCLLSDQYEPPLGNVNLKDLGQWPHGSLTPVFVKLRDLVKKNFPPIEKDGRVILAETEHFEDYLKGRVGGPDAKQAVDEVIRDLRSGSGMLILDGLDEIEIPRDTDDALKKRREQIKNLARCLASDYGGSRIVFTSRPYAYQDWEITNYNTVSLQPLTDLQIEQLVGNLYSTSGLDKEKASEKTRAFINELARRNIPRSMFDKPLLLTLLAILFLRRKNEELPARNGELYRESIMLLLDAWTKPRLGEVQSLVEKIGCGIDELFATLERIAFKAHEELYIDSQDKAATLRRGDLLEELYEISRRVDVRAAAEYISDETGILVEVGEREYEFAHRSFQEYLAASYLIRPGQKGYKSVRQRIETQPQKWRVPCILIGDILVKERSDSLWALLDDLVDHDIPSSLSSNDSRWWSVWLAAHLVGTHKLYEGIETQRHWYKQTLQDLRNWLKLLLSTPSALPLKERTEAATNLGFLGDDRAGLGLKDQGLPDILWCDIPSGEFSIGITEEQKQLIAETTWAKNWGFDDETPSRKINIGDFKISKYPITITQFKAFVDDPNGYFSDQWWNINGLRWRNRTEDRPKPFFNPEDSPNLPKHNVSWYEAMAFCAWLSERCNEKISLPTEAQWEKAARGLDHRIFSWGDDFDPSCGNVAETGVKDIAVPGCFAFESKPWGENSPTDMSGNIWEWCTTLFTKSEKEQYNYPYDADDGRELLDLGDEYMRIVRGGSFTNVPFLVKTTFRGRDKPTFRHRRQGFRIVLNP